MVLDKSLDAIDNYLEQINEDDIALMPFRSGGFINKDYDMGRVSIDLPIIQARKLQAELKKIIRIDT